jgi:hypothetical protein
LIRTAARAGDPPEWLSRPSTRQTELAGTVYGATWQGVPGWDEVCGSGGAVDVATAETAPGGKGVVWRRAAGDALAVQGAHAWQRAMRLGGRRAAARWAGQEMMKGRVGDKRGRWAVEDVRWRSGGREARAGSSR